MKEVKTVRVKCSKQTPEVVGPIESEGNLLTTITTVYHWGTPVIEQVLVKEEGET